MFRLFSADVVTDPKERTCRHEVAIIIPDPALDFTPNKFTERIGLAPKPAQNLMELQLHLESRQSRLLLLIGLVVVVMVYAYFAGSIGGATH